MMRLASDEDVDLHDRLEALAGAKGLNPTHMINALKEHCEVLVTNDMRLRKKETQIRELTASSLRLVSPDEWILELAKTTQRF